MLRIHFSQHWFNPADLACEEALYDSVSLRRFVGIDLGCEPVPDATTMLKFRHLLDKHKLGAALLTRVDKELQARGIKVSSIPSWMQSSLEHPAPPKMQTGSATRRCTKPVRASSSTLG